MGTKFDQALLEPLSLRVAEMLSANFPGVTLTNRNEWLVATWPSENPRVSEDLRIDTEPYPSVHWFKGYFADFVVEDVTDPLLSDCVVSEQQFPEVLREFLQSLFEERTACGVSLVDGKVSSGGPVDLSYEGEDAWWNDPTVLIRSWRGTYDRG